MEKARELTAQTSDDGGADLESRRLLGWLHWFRHLVLPEGRDELDAAVEMLTPCFFAGVEPLPEPLLPTLADRVSPLVPRAVRTLPDADVTAVVELLRRILAAITVDNPNRTAALTNLGNALQARFERAGALEDLDDAVRVGRESVTTTPVGHPHRVVTLTNFGNALRVRFLRTGSPEDLDEAVRVRRDAVTATPTDHVDRAAIISNLGNALLTRFRQTGGREDLDEAVRVGRESVAATPADHPDRVVTLSNFGSILHIRFQRTGAREDLDEAVRVNRESVAAAPSDHLDRAALLSNFAATLETRFEQTGSLEDLDDAVRTGREAVSAAALGVAGRAMNSTNLGNALMNRFERSGAREDLDEAVRAMHDAATATPADHPDRSGALSSLARALLFRFERAAVSEDLDDAVRTMRDAVAAMHADHPDRAFVLHQYGNTLQARFQHRKAFEDLDEAVRALRDAVAELPADHLIRAVMDASLAIALHARFANSGTGADLDEAVRLGRSAVAATPAGHPGRAAYLLNLGIALRTRFDSSGARADLDAAVEVLTQAANLTVASTSVRIRAGQIAGRLLAAHEPARATELLSAAVRLLPQVAPRQLPRADKQYALGGYAGLAADAAALALSDPRAPAEQRPGTALQLLEVGRGVLIGQALHIRGDLTELTREHPELADRFAWLRDRLDRDPDAASTAESGAHDRHRLSREFDDLLTRIRAVDGFAGFGLPPTREQLLAQAAHGPVVVFNISRYRSDALLLGPTGITALPLPGLSPEAVLDQVNLFQDALSATEGIDFAQRLAGQKHLHQVLEWLWDNAVGPVLDTLGHTTTPASGTDRPRVWWIPGGALGLLPLHAAGHHTRPGARTALDRVVSSYTPTVAALRHARRTPSTDDPGTRRALIVAMPTTPDLPGHDLEYVSTEAVKVATHLPDALTLTEPDPDDHSTTDEPPTTATVLKLLSTHAIAHFACHGLSDPVDPSRSRLLLHDHATDPLTVTALAPLRLDHARLAYLSACETALTRDTRLIDEAIHLTSAFQLAGYPHVIGTLWAVGDYFSPDIADMFYTALTTGDHRGPDTTNAARALHDTIRTVRDLFPTKPALWAAYLHAGA